MVVVVKMKRKPFFDYANYFFNFKGFLNHANIVEKECFYFIITKSLLAYQIIFIIFYKSVIVEHVLKISQIFLFSF